MKRNLLKKGILAIMLVFGMAAFVGCGEDEATETVHPLIGTWVDNVFHDAVRFSGNEVRFCSDTTVPNPIYTVYGTYTISGSALTVNRTGVLQPEQYLFSISGSVLTITATGNASTLTGTYSKQ